MTGIMLAAFENFKIRRFYDENKGVWYFSIVDVISVLIQQNNFQTARNYWKVLKNRLKKEGSESVTKCNQLKMPAADGKSYMTDVSDPETLLRLIQSIPSPIIHQEWAGVSVKKHKDIKGLKTQNLRDHMSEAEWIFTALAELSTRQIAESMQATGVPENAQAGKHGGKIAKKARLELEQKTGKSIVTGENFLPQEKPVLI
jgi:hypothetical protein